MNILRKNMNILRNNIHCFQKIKYVKSLGAKGVINRKNFDCWGNLPDVNDNSNSFGTQAVE